MYFLNININNYVCLHSKDLSFLRNIVEPITNKSYRSFHSSSSLYINEEMRNGFSIILKELITPSDLNRIIKLDLPDFAEYCNSLGFEFSDNNIIYEGLSYSVGLNEDLEKLKLAYLGNKTETKISDESQSINEIDYSHSIPLEAESEGIDSQGVGFIELNVISKTRSYNHSLELQEYANEMFDRYVILYSKTVTVNGDGTHFKKHHHELVLRSRGLLVVHYKVWVSVTRFYNTTIFKFISKLKPVAFTYILEWSKIIANNELNVGGNFESHAKLVDIAPNWNDFPGSSVYGLANGANQLLIFQQSTAVKMELDINFNMNTSEGSTFKVVTTKINNKEPVIVFNENFISSGGSYDLQSTQVESVDFAVRELHSMFYNASYKNIFKQIFSSTTNLGFIDFVQKSEANRSFVVGNSISMKGNDKLNFVSSGYSSNVSTNTHFELSLDDELVLGSMLFWLFSDIIQADLLKHYNAEDTKEIFSRFSGYCLNVVKTYALSKASYKVGSDINSFSLKFELERKINCPNKLHELYKKHVNLGDIVPLSPIQSLYYIDKTMLLKWRYYSITSGVLLHDLFKVMYSIIPSFNNNSKRKLSLLIKLNFNRSVDYYCFGEDPLYDMATGQNYSIEEVLKEMLVKTMILSGHNDSMLYITEGKLSQDGRTSPVITSPYINSYFCKFDISNMDELEELIKGLTLKEKSSKLDGFKKSTKLVEFMPRLLERFLQSDE